MSRFNASTSRLSALGVACAALLAVSACGTGDILDGPADAPTTAGSLDRPANAMSTNDVLVSEGGAVAPSRVFLKGMAAAGCDRSVGGRIGRDIVIVGLSSQ